MKNKVYFQKIRIILFIIKHSFLKGWYTSYESDKNIPPPNQKSLAHYKLAALGREALESLE